jgi:hypothetical protein
MILEFVTAEILCRMCVSETKRAPVGNLQTVKHQHNTIPLSEVGIPILRLQSGK